MDREQTKKAFVFEARTTYTAITNGVLEKYGKSAHIDHHSLKYQTQKVEAEGDTLLTQLLDRTPETYISRLGILQQDIYTSEETLLSIDSC